MYCWLMVHLTLRRLAIAYTNATSQLMESSARTFSRSESPASCLGRRAVPAYEISACRVRECFALGWLHMHSRSRSIRCELREFGNARSSDTRSFGSERQHNNSE